MRLKLPRDLLTRALGFHQNRVVHRSDVLVADCGIPPLQGDGPVRALFTLLHRESASPPVTRFLDISHHYRESGPVVHPWKLYLHFPRVHDAQVPLPHRFLPSG